MQFECLVTKKELLDKSVWYIKSAQKKNYIDFFFGKSVV